MHSYKGEWAQQSSISLFFLFKPLREVTWEGKIAPYPRICFAKPFMQGGLLEPRLRPLLKAGS